MTGRAGFAILCVIVACGGGGKGDGGGDGGVPTIEVGTGDVGFQAFAAELTITPRGPQGFPGLVLNARSTGLDPGLGQGSMDSTNPTTRFKVVASGQTFEPPNPITLPYKPTADGAAFELHDAFRMPFEVAGISAIRDQDVAITVDATDQFGHHASDTRTVHVVAPAGFDADAGPLPDAGAPDAGAPDAGP